ncbi:hypothetical protein GCM10020331_043820 [Ectobacillus funiculus]
MHGLAIGQKSRDMREGLLSTEMMEIRGEACILSIITDITDRVAVEKGNRKNSLD